MAQNKYREMSANYRLYKSRMSNSLYDRAIQLAEDICDDARMRLQMHIQDGIAMRGYTFSTGAMSNSIHYEEQPYKSGIQFDLVVDAESPDGVKYAEFFEHGTGIYNEWGDGRQTPWSYQDLNGNWHKTQGQIAKPFMGPAILDHAEDMTRSIRETLKTQETSVFKRDKKLILTKRFL